MTEAGSTLRAARPRRTRWWAAALAAVGVVAAVAVIAWLVGRSPTGGDGPENVTAPVLTRDPLVGQVVSVVPGRWEGASPVAYRWQRCTPDEPASCRDVGGIGGDRYLVTQLDQGMALRVIEIAAAAEPVVRPDGSVVLPDGAATVRSALTAPVGPADVETATVPDVIGLPMSEALALLGEAGFPVGLGTSGTSVDDCDPMVQGQDPPPGVEHRVGDVVSVVAPERGVDCDLDEFPPFGPPQG
jgi:hypothetical protein